MANESTVSHAIFYPNFESARPQIDAGLLILNAPVAAPALPMATPSKPELRKPGTPVTIAGWGLTDPKSEVVPKVLRAAEGLKLQSTGFCHQHIPDLPFDFPAFTPASQSCALDTPDHTVSGCFGDSGGPAIAHRAHGTPVEIGIIVKGSVRCAPTQPNVFTQGRPDFCVGRRMDRVRRTRRTKAPHSQAGATVPRGRARRRSRRPRRSPVHCGTGSWAEPEGETHCTRLDWTGVKCHVRWHQGGSRYYGYFVVRHVITPAIDIGHLVKYRIHWVKEGCGSHSRGRSCTVHTRHN